MICKQCGLEYPDDLDACPGCGAPNGEVEAQPMSEAERDSFDGVTIEAHDDAGEQETYRVYDQDDVKRQQEKEVKRAKWQAILALLKNNVKAVLVIAVILGLLVMLIPTLLSFAAMAIVFYGVFALFNYFFRR